MLTVEDTINRINKYFKTRESKPMNHLDETLYCAVHHLSDYQQHLIIQNNIKNPRLTWANLEDSFGKPIHFIQKETKRNCSANGWIILYELHITECGSFVIGTDGVQLKYEDCEFYRYEK